MKKTRKVTTEVEYEVCDLCGEEITTCHGNSLWVGGDVKKDMPEKQYWVHLMNDGDCGRLLIIKEIEKRHAKR